MEIGYEKTKLKAVNETMAMNADDAYQSVFPCNIFEKINTDFGEKN